MQQVWRCYVDRRLCTVEVALCQCTVTDDFSALCSPSAARVYCSTWLHLEITGLLFSAMIHFFNQTCDKINAALIITAGFLRHFRCHISWRNGCCRFGLVVARWFPPSCSLPNAISTDGMCDSIRVQFDPMWGNFVLVCSQPPGSTSA